MTRIVIIEAAECEQLPQLQTRDIKGMPHGRKHVLIATAVTWQEFYAAQLPPLDAPWWAHRQHTEDSFHGICWVDPSLPFFAGHFPGNPILPGVAQINWAIETADSTFPTARAEFFKGMSNIKFKAPIRPTTWLALDLERQSNHVSFKFYDAHSVRTQGRLQYHD